MDLVCSDISFVQRDLDPWEVNRQPSPDFLADGLHSLQIGLYIGCPSLYGNHTPSALSRRPRGQVVR
jgi:hypothetical protein